MFTPSLLERGVNYFPIFMASSKLYNIHTYSFVCKSQKKIRHPANQRRKNESRGLFNTKSLFRFVSWRPRDQRPNTSLLGTNGLILNCARCASTHTQPKKKWNIVTMVPPIRRLPAAPILQVSAIAVRRATDNDHYNPVMWLTLMKLTNSLFYWLLFYVQWLSAHADWRWVFEVIARVFSCLMIRYDVHLPQLLVDILFAVTPLVLVMFRHDFGRGGRGTIVTILSYDREVGCAFFFSAA